MWRTIGSLPRRSMFYLKIPRVRCEALKVTNEYSTPPAPKCVKRKLFLLVPDPRLPCQDYCQEQPKKTLAYASFAILGWRGQPAMSWWNTPFGEMCPGAEMSHEAFHHLQWLCHPGKGKAWPWNTRSRGWWACTIWHYTGQANSHTGHKSQHSTNYASQWASCPNHSTTDN